MSRVTMAKQPARTIVGIQLEAAETQNQTTNHNQGTGYQSYDQLSNIFESYYILLY